MTIVDRRYSVAEGTAVKAPCRAATTANITLTGEQTIDGIAVVEGDRVLVKNQTDGTENGIYSVSTGNWTRTRDFDGSFDIVTGTRIFVTAGTSNGGAEFVVSTTGDITIGTTSISFTSIIATAIASAAAAAASASAASTSASAASTSATAAATSASAAAASAVLAASIWYSTKAAAEAATIGGSVPIIVLAGYTARGDAPIAMYVRASSEPSHPGKLQSTDGAWWQISPSPVIWPEQFGAVGDAVTDDITAIQNAEACRFALSCELRFMAKNYYLDNPANWEVSRPRWQGADHNSTLLTMDGNSAVCIWLKGSGGNTSGYMRDIVLWAPAGRTTGQALRLDGDATYQPDEFTATNLKITGTGTWDIPIFLYGADRLSPLGLRVVTLNNLFIGRDVSVGVYGETVVQLQIYGGGIYGGTSNQLQLAGNVGTSKGCTDVLIQGFKINGQLNVDDCTGGIFNMICGSIVFGADADDNCILGYNSGATTNSGSGNNTAALV